MNIFYAILLGLVQGVAEFLPISSSGHLALFENIVGGVDLAIRYSCAFFNIMLNLGRLVGVAIAFWC